MDAQHGADLDDQSLSVSVEWRGRVAVAAVGGEIDLLTAPGLSSALMRLLAEKPDAVVVDLLKVEFLASAGLATLVAVFQAADPIPMRVVAVGATTLRPLHLTGLDRQLPVFTTLEQALAAQ